jgi:uncharacterized membrane protein (UPF0127 family)
MRIVKVKSLTNQAVIADMCHVADSFVSRLKGLMGRTRLNQGEGLLIPRCNNVHMWGMRMSLDIVFLREVECRENQPTYRVTSLALRVRPWRLLPLVSWSASETLEIGEGEAERLGLRVGDEVCISSP